MVAKFARFNPFKLNFTDNRLTAFGGYTFLRGVAVKAGLSKLLTAFKPIKQRKRGASDQENLWSLITCLVSGRGRLQDVDELRASRVDRLALGLDQVSDSRRIGKWLHKATPANVSSLRQLATCFAKRLIPQVIAAQLKELPYVPVFVDASEIEVKGNQEGVARTYSGSKKYWLISGFVGPMQVSSRLEPGNLHPAGDWRTQLEEDVVPVIPADTPVWVLMDNAYYNGKIVSFLDEHGYDWSISLIDDQNKGPIVALAKKQANESNWESILDDPDIDLDDDVEACWVTYQPKGWHRAVPYVVIRTWKHDKKEADELFSHSHYVYGVITVSTNKHSLKETVRRHRSKQGCENHFKGPLIEMDLHHPPTRRLHANQLYYSMSSDIAALLAQMLLITLRRWCLPAKYQHHGLRRLIRDFIRSVAKLTRSGGYYHLKFSKDRTDLRPLIYASNVYDTW